MDEIRIKCRAIAEKLYDEVNPLLCVECYGDDFYDMKEVLNEEVNKVFGCIEK